MPKPDYRNQVWRRALSLFYEEKKLGVVGPFKKAGYRNVKEGGLRIEVRLGDGKGGTMEADIVSTKDGEWLAFELTIDPNQPKEPQLERYLTADASWLANEGLGHYDNAPHVILGRLSPPAAHVEDGDFSVLILGEELGVQKLEHLTDAALAAALQEFEGKDLKHLPELKFVILPEQKGHELRPGLMASVMQAFGPGSAGVSVSQMVKDGLDELLAAVPTGKRVSLEGVAEHQLKLLLQESKLNQYMERGEDGLYRPKAGVNITHFKTKEKITRIISAWAMGSGSATTLESFSEEE